MVDNAKKFPMYPTIPYSRSEIADTSTHFKY